MSDSKTSIETLVRESRRLRDYLVHVGATGHGDLTAALWPFEAGASQTPGEAQTTALFEAFQKVHEDARKVVDSYTLNEVIQGRSPQHGRSKSLSTAAIAMLGAYLVFLAFSFSNWAGKTAFVLTEAVEFTSFDHFGQVMKLVELEYYFDAAEPDALPSDLEPQMVYLEGIATLARHYSKENDIQSRMAELMRSARPVWARWNSLRRTVCEASLGTEFWREALSCPILPTTVASPPDGAAVATTSSRPVVGLEDGVTAAAVTNVPVNGDAFFRGRLAEIDKLRLDTVADAGRSSELAQDYLQSVQRVQAMSVDLKGMLDTLQHWTLPIIYGMLGSVVYCIWRVLSPNVAALGIFHSFLRTAFAGLAALTLSMLLVPSNTLALGTDADRPLVYLVSFVFGYSIEAFVSTLNNLNGYLSTRLAPKEPKTG